MVERIDLRPVARASFRLVKKETPSVSSPPDELSFEDILARLSSVVDQLEQGDLPLERSLAFFEEGISLSRLGSRRLDQAEARIEQLMADEDGISTRPLPDEDTE